MKNIAIIGIILSAVLILAGLIIETPDKKIGYSYSKNGYEEYVGGDAYNYIIEASLRGGEIAGAKAQKAIFISAGSVLLIISLFGLNFSNRYRQLSQQNTLTVQIKQTPQYTTEYISKDTETPSENHVNNTDTNNASNL